MPGCCGMTQVTAAGLGGGAASRPSRRGGPCEEPGAAGGGNWEVSGTWTIVLHCGQDARLPAALPGTFSARPQPVQWNSIESVVWGMEDIAGRNDQRPNPNDQCRASIRFWSLVLGHRSFVFHVRSPRTPLGDLPILRKACLSIVSILRSGQ